MTHMLVLSFIDSQEIQQLVIHQQHTSPKAHVSKFANVLVVKNV